MLHPDFSTTVHCGICQKTCSGELHINNPLVGNCLPKVIAYNCPSCSQMYCEECMDSKIKARGFLGMRSFDKNKSLCPNCHAPIFPYPDRVLLQQEETVTALPGADLFYECPQDAKAYLKADEKFLCLHKFMGSYNLLTDKRLVMISKPKIGEIFRNIPFENIIDLDIYPGRDLGFGVHQLLIKVKSPEKSEEWIQLVYDYQYEKVRALAQEVCKATGRIFAPPKNLSKPYVEFLTKDSIRWPMKCARCLSSEKLTTKSIQLERGKGVGEIALQGLVGGVLGQLINLSVGKHQIAYAIPYCAECANLYAVIQLKRFDGVRATIAYTNQEYIDQFITMNSKPSLYE